MIKVEDVPSDDIVYKVFSSTLIPGLSFYLHDGTVETVMESSWTQFPSKLSLEVLTLELLNLEEALSLES